MKLTKILLEYPGAFTPRPEEEWDKNQEDFKKRSDPNYLVQQYIENGSVGDLDLSNFNYVLGHLLTSLPDNLTINGKLDLSSCFNLTDLPKNLVVKKDLFINQSGVKKIPDDLKVGMNIEASSCYNLRHIPENFTVNGDLLLDGCPKVILPKGLKVTGTLYIGSRIKLPTDLDIGRLRIT